MDVQSEGESGREFRREATRIHCKEREGRESMFMEECDSVQCGRWDGLHYQVLKRGERRT